MLKISLSHVYRPEKEYVCKIIFHEFLGVDYKIEWTEPTTYYTVSINNLPIQFPDILFSTPLDKWLKAETYPASPLLNITVEDDTIFKKNIPVLYGKANANPGFSIQDIDFLGSIFFLLTRYEEVDQPLDDNFGRYDFRRSILFKEGLLDRPLVNEYVELLKKQLIRIAPELVFKPHTYNFSLSHDVDAPVTFTGGWMDTVKKSIGDIVYRRSISLLLRRYTGKLRYAISRSFDQDPNNNFEFLMDVADSQGIKSIFNFIPLPGPKPEDSTYSLHDKHIRDLLKRIHQRGFEIGFHPSFNSYQNFDQTKLEIEELNDTLQSLGIKPATRGRQHYLRWSNPITWRIWNALGLKEDSSVGYDGINGFRTGCCFTYTVFDLLERKHLPLREEPLILMDINSNAHAHTSTIIKESQYFYEVCKFFGGRFTLLFHNNYILSAQQKKLFSELIRMCAR